MAFALCPFGTECGTFANLTLPFTPKTIQTRVFMAWDNGQIATRREGQIQVENVENGIFGQGYSRERDNIFFLSGDLILMISVNVRKRCEKSTTKLC